MSSSFNHALSLSKRPAVRSVLFARPQPEALHGRSRWFWVGVWLPVIVAIAFICGESTSTFSSENTSGWLRPVWVRFFGQISDEHWAILHHIGRKAGHFAGFGLVGLTFLRAWLITLARFAAPLWRLRGFALAISSTFLVAGGDEWHQTFLPSRTGAFSDVLLDTSGALILCGACWLAGIFAAKLAARKVRRAHS